MGKLLLRKEPIIFNGNTLELTEEGAPSRSVGPSTKTGGLFVPRRAAVSRPRAGLGHSRKLEATSTGKQSQVTARPTDSQPSSSQSQQSKGQNDFRKMLGS